MSDIEFYVTAMLIIVRGDAFIFSCLSERKQSSLAAGTDAEVLLLYLNSTADVLSQNPPMCLNVKSPTTYFSTTHPRTDHANSILFIVSISLGFL